MESINTGSGTVVRQTNRRPVTPWLLSPSGGATGATLASHFRRLRVCSRPWVLVGRRCTFEAMIVHLRRLPVTAAGHDLDIIQSKLVSEGSMLLSWPWTGHWRGFAPKLVARSSASCNRDRRSWKGQWRLLRRAHVGALTLPAAAMLIPGLTAPLLSASRVRVLVACAGDFKLFGGSDHKLEFGWPLDCESGTANHDCLHAHRHI